MTRSLAKRSLELVYEEGTLVGDPFQAEALHQRTASRKVNGGSLPSYTPLKLVPQPSLKQPKSLYFIKRPRMSSQALDVINTLVAFDAANLLKLRPPEDATLEQYLRLNKKANPRNIFGDVPCTSTYSLAAQYFNLEADLIFIPFQELSVRMRSGKHHSAFTFDELSLKQSLSDFWTKGVLNSDGSSQSLAQFEIEYNSRVEFVEKSAEVLASCAAEGRGVSVVLLDLDAHSWMLRSENLVAATDTVLVDSSLWEVEVNDDTFTLIRAEVLKDF